MRVIKVRRTSKADGGRVKRHRLIVRTGRLEAGDVVQHPDGFCHRLRGVQVGVPASLLTRRLYDTRRAEERPAVYIWEFDCAGCGGVGITKRGASWRPTRRICHRCRQQQVGAQLELAMEMNDGG